MCRHTRQRRINPCPGRCRGSRSVTRDHFRQATTLRTLTNPACGALDERRGATGSGLYGPLALDRVPLGVRYVRTARGAAPLPLLRAGLLIRWRIVGHIEATRCLLDGLSG